MLYPGGYGGIQPVEGGIANLCCVVQQRHLARVGHRWESFLAKTQQDCPHLAMRLAGAEPLANKSFIAAATAGSAVVTGLKTYARSLESSG